MNIIYHQIGPREWRKQQFSERCPERAGLFSKCQGVKGHSGEHWAYQPNGSYAWSVNKNESSDSHIAGGSTPPDHENYVPPQDKLKDYYLCHNIVSDVIDEELINKLEADEDLGEDVAINKPLSEQEIEDLKYDGILDKDIIGGFGEHSDD